VEALELEALELEAPYPLYPLAAMEVTVTISAVGGLTKANATIILTG
jgi:hypothetical protein